MPVATLVCKVEEVENDYGKEKMKKWKNTSKVVRPGICKGRWICAFLPMTKEQLFLSFLPGGWVILLGWEPLLLQNS